MSQRHPESGSALIYVLIGVVLFGALTFAMGRISQTGNVSSTSEVNSLQVSEILQFARSLHTAAQTMQVDGLTDRQISFDSPLLTGYANANCAADNCHIFLPDGGGVSYTKPEAAWLDPAEAGSGHYGDWVFSGANAVLNAGSDGTDPANAELIAILPWIRQALCVSIDDQLNIANPNGAPPSSNADISDLFTGTYAVNNTIGGAAAGQLPLNGQRTGCFASAGAYYFYQVLIAR